MSKTIEAEKAKAPENQAVKEILRSLTESVSQLEKVVKRTTDSAGRVKITRKVARSER